ncbi:EARP-interacting protein homolog [Chironomus tepperi]|uniref:EARP-interacting protein homolog n=1 Tax=Chironomus tepperi TaxID=113505 RepID=UPI00391EF7D2
MESIIYGIEFQARSLVSQQDAEEIRFFIGTQMINGKNQIHLLEVDDDNNKLKTKTFSHEQGEIWKLTSCPTDKLLASVYSSNLVMKSAVLKIPENIFLDPSVETLDFEDVEVLETEPHGTDIKTTEFHPTNTNVLATVIDSKVLIFNRAESKSQVVAEMTSKNSAKFAGGKWNNSNQFVVMHENGVKSYDTRESNHVAWEIPNAHIQPVRDLDVNPNKAFTIATVGDDCTLKIWDIRNNKTPVFSRRDHQHWIFSVSFNKFHDQLILTSGSDGKVLLTCAASCSSETNVSTMSRDINDKDDDDNDDIEEEFQLKTRKSQLKDGVLEKFEQHEDSVYCAEWCSADPWIFCSCSWDGRVVVSRIPKKYKYQILL